MSSEATRYARVIVGSPFATMVFAGVLLFASTCFAASARRPNIVFILADDLGYGDVNCFGQSYCRIATPGFDRLAREGVRFQDAHVNASVCVPTRMAIMTGRYPWRFGDPSPGGPWGFLGLRFPTTQHTLGRMMSDAGYRTAYVGKWHLGTQMATKDQQPQTAENVDFTRPLQIGPPQFQFAESYILPGSLDMFPYAFVHNNRWVGDVTAQKGWSAFNRVGPAATDFEDTKVLDTLATRAEHYIAAQGQATQQDADAPPFFLYLALTAPHTPVSPSDKFSGRSALGVYGDFVMETDDCVARVLTALDRAKLTENTLVIASSDHGAAAYAGANRKATPGQNQLMQQQGHYSCGPYRGYKFSVYEGGLRVPMVARWPGVTPANASCHRLVGLIDLMATLAEIADVKLDANQAVDSISFLPLLQHPAAEGRRSSMLMQGSAGHVVRSGDWKLALCPGSGCDGRFGNTPRRVDAWRAARKTFGRAPKSEEDLAQAPFVQLFNLKDDPGESRNLAAEHPDRVRELYRLFQNQVAAGRSNPGTQQPNDREEIGAFFTPAFVLAP
ncbi:MAG: arylsulfatase [Planctomycetales bacterium]|nr:arylsulfatase [Planctomycetales bacterium]